jgi:ABC-type cobalamin/Fe3+-siderophores transport system ATPase subunit
LAPIFEDEIVVLDHGRISRAGCPDKVITDEIIERVFESRRQSVVRPSWHAFRVTSDDDAAKACKTTKLPKLGDWQLVAAISCTT